MSEAPEVTVPALEDVAARQGDGEAGSATMWNIAKFKPPVSHVLGHAEAISAMDGQLDEKEMVEATCGFQSLAEQVRAMTKRLMTCTTASTSPALELLDALDAVVNAEIKEAALHSSISQTMADLRNACFNLLNKFRTHYQEDGKLDKWNAKLFQHEFTHIDSLIADLNRDVQRLHENADICDRLMPCLQKVNRDTIPTSVPSSILKAIEEDGKFQEQQRMAMAERRKSHFTLMELGEDLERNKAEREKVESGLEQLKAFRSRLGGKWQELQDRTAMSFEECNKLLAAERKALAEDMEGIAKMKADDIKDLIAQDKKRLEELKECKRACEEEILNATNARRNHLIFLVDESGSMAGARWTNSKAAVEAFIAARQKAGTQDRVTIIVFNSLAKRLCGYVPLSADWRSALQAERPTLGTDFGAAWREAQQCCVDFGQPIDVPIVIFITDGTPASGGAAASQVAQAMYRQYGSGTADAGMITVGVNVDSAANSAILKPVVAAGNGGATTREVFGERRELLLEVDTQDMAGKFAELACITNMKQHQWRARKAFYEMQRKNQEESFKQEVHAIEEMYKVQLEATNAKARQSKSASDEAHEEDDVRLQRQKDKCEQQMKEVDDRIAATKRLLKACSEKVTKQELEIKEETKLLEENKEQGEELLRLAQEGNKQQITSRKGSIAAAHRASLSGTEKEFLEYRDLLNQLQTKLRRRTQHMETCKSLLRSISNFVLSIRQQISDPMDINQLSAARAAFAPEVFASILSDLHIPCCGAADTDENLRLVLTAITKQIAGRSALEEGDLVDRVVDQIMHVGYSAEDFCCACGKVLEKDDDDEGGNVGDARDVELENNLLKRFREDVVDDHMQGLDVNPKAQQEAKSTKNRLEKARKALQAAKKKQAQSEDGDEAVAEAEDEVETLKVQLEILREEAERYQEEIKHFALPMKVITKIFKKCNATYDKCCAKLVITTVHQSWWAFNHTVFEPMKSFRQKSNVLQLALSNGDETLLQLGDRSVGNEPSSSSSSS